MPGRDESISEPKEPDSPTAGFELAELLPEAALLVRTDGEILAANEPAARMLGVACEALRGRRLEGFVDDPPEKLARYLKACSRSRRPVPGSLQMRDAGGSAVGCRSEGALLRPGSSGARAAVFLRCVSESSRGGAFVELDRKLDTLRGAHRAALRSNEELERQVEERAAEIERSYEGLRETEQRYASLFEQSVDQLLIHDSEGRIVACNSEACRALGYTREELLSMRVADIATNLIPEKERRGPEPTLWQRALRAEPGRVVGIHEGEHVRRDGTTFPIEARVGSVDYGGERMMFAAATDVTERKAAEEARRRSEERHRAVVDTAADAIIAMSAEGEIRSFNAGAERIFGYAADEAVGRPLEMLMPERFRQAHERGLARYLRTGEARVIGGTVELAGLGKDGAEFPVELSLAETREEDARMFVGIIRDITERKRSEEELRESEGRNRAILQALPDLVFRLSGDGEYLDFQAGEGEELYVPREEIIGSNIRDTLPYEVADGALHYLDRALRTGEMQVYEYQLPGPAGPQDFEARLVASGEDEVLCVVRDVTERKRSEEEIRRLNEELEGRVERRTAELTDTLGRYEQSIARESALRNASAALVAAPDREGIYAAALEAVLPFIDEAAGTRVSIWSGSVEKDVCVGAAGDRAAEISGKETFVREFPDRVRIPLVEGRPVEISPREAAGFHHAFRFDTKLGTIFMVPLLVRGRFEGRIVVASDSGLPGEIRYVLEALGSQVALALERADLIEDLHRRQGEERFRALIQNSSDVIMILDGDRKVSYVSPTIQRIFGRNAAGGGILAFVHFDDIARARSFLDDLQRSPDGVSSTEVRVRHADGSWRHVEWRGNNLLDDPAVGGMVINARDITGRKRDEEALRESERRLRAVMGGAPVILFAVDRGGVFTLVEGRSLEALGVEPGELAGRSVFEVYPDSPEVLGHVRRSLAGEEVAATVQIEGLAFEARYSPLREPDGEITGAIGVATDVTARRELERELEHRAFHDSLTDLPNRALFMDRLEQALVRAGRLNETLAVLFLDLDNFKLVNDSLSHEAGDGLLVEIADRVRSCLRRTDTAARFGGDEFTVLVEKIGGERGAVMAAERIVRALEEPFAVAGHELPVTFSVGVALSTGGSDAAGLLRDADMAMYRAKSGGKARYEIFDESMNVRALERLRLEADLRRAVERGEIEVHYQPVVGVEGGSIRAVEALARWEHPERGVVPPGEFIPVAEETGLIVPLGRAVLEKACRQVQSWRRLYPSGPLSVGVNLSARQFASPGLVEEVARVLRESGLDPRALTLEITESVMLEDTESNAGVLRRLKDEVGVRLAVDDFGKGYSSLTYLKRLPLDTLKIDRSFVGGIDEEAGDMAIVSAVITFARTLGMRVVAEGVETAAQLASLRGMDCDLAQGYYLARPMPPSELEELLREGSPLAEPAAAETTDAFGYFADAQRAAERSHLINRAIAASSDCIVITDPNKPDHPMVYVNRSFERLTGYTAEEAIGRNCRFLQNGDDDQPSLDGLRAALAAGRGWAGVVRNYRKDGALFYNELSVSPVRDETGRLVSYIGIQNDVTGRFGG